VKTQVRIWRVAFLAIFLFTLAFSTSAYGNARSEAGASDWPMFKRDVRHTGQSPYVGILTMPILEWAIQLPTEPGEASTGLSQASDGTVYVGANGKLFAINPQDGTILWEYLGGWGRSTPAVAPDGTIFWGFDDSFAALTPNGQQVWRVNGLSGNLVFGSSPVIGQDSNLYFVHDGVFSFTPQGGFRWLYPFSWFAHSSPAVGADGTIYLGGVDLYPYLYAFRPDGSLRWRRLIEAGFYDGVPAIAADGTIYLGTSGGRLYAYSPDGTRLWVFQSDESNGYSETSPTIGSDGTIYFGTFVQYTNPGKVYALHPDGTLKWKYTIVSGVVAPIVVDRDGNVFACASWGGCYGIASDGTLLWVYNTDPDDWYRTMPHLLADGEMLVLQLTGTVLYKFRAAGSIYRLHLPLIAANANN
jgi:outer membrane protein assembly factor BamB